jgi:hypothetical protein
LLNFCWFHILSILTFPFFLALAFALLGFGRTLLVFLRDVFDIFTLLLSENIYEGVLWIFAVDLLSKILEFDCFEADCSGYGDSYIGCLA